LEELQELELLDEGEMVGIPDLEIEDLIEENTLSVIVRCLNPHAHKVGGLVKSLPPIWGMEDRVRGRGVGEHRRATCNIIRGLPIHMVKKEIVESLLGPMGKVDLVELHAKNSNSLEYVRAQVSINTEEPLQFRRTARFRSGATIPTELEYEKLLKVCYTYKRLTHDQSRCPLQSNTSQELVKGGQAKSKEQNLRHKLLEKELKAKEVLQKSSGKGVVIRSSQTGEIQRGGRNKSSENREDKRKGKRVASSPQMVWKQKDGRG
ncbi:unnamed protein product, partial [Brassica oleracea]